jgi:histidinol-phosphate aminotransferase
MKISNLVRPNILSMKPYSSARDEFDIVGNVILLDANENPFDSEWNRYPDPNQKALKAEISTLKNIDVNQIFLGNGSDEAVDLVLRVFCEPGIDNAIVPDPTYGMYEVAATIQNTEIRKVPLTSDFQLDPDKMLASVDEFTKLIFLCNPNNPTGNLLDQNAIEEIIEKFKGIVIIDEAYIDFAGSESYITKLDKYDSVIVLQTFSKVWGLAGLRIGAAYASEEIIHLLNKVKPPYNLNVFTQQKVTEIIQSNTGQLSQFIEFVNYEKTRIAMALSKSEVVIKVFPSDSNFLLVRFKDHVKVFETLLSQNLIVRDRSMAMHCNGCLRISIGTYEENELLINTINKL